MSTYIQLTRDDFEDWLDSIGFRGKWKIKAGRGGVYQLHLSDTVAIDINSTTGSQAEVMGHGKASMSVRLVSRITGKVLNKKAMGQSHFKRTVNWRMTWKKGVDRMRNAYLKSESWYDSIAAIEDRDKYKADMLTEIEANPGWENNDFLSDIHRRVEQGSVLSQKQRAAITRIKAPAQKPDPSGQGGAVAENDPLLVRMRNLWVAAKKAGDDWTMTFAHSNALRYKRGQPLSQKVLDLLDKKFRKYRVREASARVADMYLGVQS